MPEFVPYKHSNLFADLNSKPEKSEPFKSTPISEVNLNRYPAYFYNMDNEELYAQQQSGWDKAKNGLVKMAGLAGSTIVNGTLGLANGLLKWMDTGEFSSLYDNPVTRSMDEWNKQWEDQYAHYYTQAQKNAAWWESENLFSGNMLWDKVVKNMGFALGAAATGWGFNAAMKGLGITASMMKAGQGLEALSAIDEGIIASAPATRLSGVLKSLTEKASGVGRGLGRALSSGSASDALTAAFASTGEASMEALHNANEFRDTLIEQFKTENLRDPNEQEMKEINQYAAGVGKTSFALNMGLLTATQYIQLPKIFSTSVRGDKAALNEIVQDVATETFSAAKKTGLRAVASKTKNALGLVFSPEEAFEESAQYSITKGTQDYYDKKYRGEDVSFWDSLGEGVKEGFATEEGLENLFLGGLSGGLMTSGAFTFGKTGKLAERGIFGEGGQRAINTSKAVEALNKVKLKDIFTSGVDAANRAITLQEERDAAIRNGNILEAQDAEQDYAHNYIYQRIKYGKEDILFADIDGVKEKAMTDAGFLELQQTGRASKTDTREQFLNRLTNLTQQVRETAEAYNNIKEKYENVRDEKGNPLYTDAVMQKLSYAAAKIRNYNKRINTLSTELLQHNIDASGVINLADINSAEAKEISQKAIAEIEAIEDPLVDKKDLQTKLADVAAMSQMRKTMAQEYKDIVEKPVAAQEVKPFKPVKPVTAEGEEKEEVKKVVVPTKTGDKEVEVGEEYFLGRVVEYDAKGNEVYRMPTLRILGENEDGTIRIKDSKGQERDITKETLADYKLGKVSTLKSNKTANYFYNHWNDVFTYNFGKDYGGKRPGRLEYDAEKNILYFVYKDSKGNIQFREVDNSDFIAQEGYAQARMEKKDTLKPETPEQKAAREAYTEEKEIKKAREERAKKRGPRLEILNKLAKAAKEQLDSVEKNIAEKASQLKKIEGELNSLRERKATAPKGRAEQYVQKKKFKTIFSTTTRAISKLSNLKESVEQEIATLKADKEEIEFNLSYFTDAAQNVDELPTDAREFVKELKEQINMLNDLAKQTAQDLGVLASISNEISNTIKEFVSFLKDAMQRFDKEYPSYIKDSFNRILAAKNDSILKEMPVVKQYLADFALIEDTEKEITLNEEKLEEVVKETASLFEKMKDIDKQISAKKAILKPFEEILAIYDAAKKAEEEARLNKELHDKFFKSQKDAQQNSGEASEFSSDEVKEEEAKKVPDPRKPIQVLFSATVSPAVVKTEADKKHDRFLSNLDSVPDEIRTKMRRIYVTANNEKELKLSGLIKSYWDVDKFEEGKEPILSVYVLQENGEYFFVNEKGEKLSKVGEEINQEEIVYGVMPSVSLEDSFGLRYDPEKVTAEEAKSVQEQWEEERKNILSLTDSITTPEPFFVSNGRAFHDKGSKNKIVGTLVSKEQLANGKPVLKVSTTGTVTHQGRSVKVPQGRVVVSNGGTFQTVHNRNLTEKEVETVYQVLKEFVKSANKNKVFDSKLTKFLQGVLFFQSPYEKADGEVVKNTVARNQFYFHKGDFYFGQNEVAIPFTVSGLELYEKEVKAFLKGTYNNVNNTFLSPAQFSQPFIEYVLDDKGQLVEKEWKNYQEYLLSPEGRTEEEIPLSTTVAAPTEGAVPFTNRYSYTFKFSPKSAEDVSEKKVGEIKEASGDVNLRRKEAVDSIEITSDDKYSATVEDAEGNTTTLSADEKEDLLKEINKFFLAEEDLADDSSLPASQRAARKTKATTKLRELREYSEAPKSARKKPVVKEKTETPSDVEVAASTTISTTAISAQPTVKKSNLELAEQNVLKILNLYAEPSDGEEEYQGDEIGDFVPEEEEEGQSTLGKIIAELKSLPYYDNLTSKTIKEYKQKLKDTLEKLELESMFDEIASNIDKAIKEELSNLEKTQPVAQPVAKKESSKDKAMAFMDKMFTESAGKENPNDKVLGAKSVSGEPKGKPMTLAERRKSTLIDPNSKESQNRIVVTYDYALGDVEAEKAYILKNTPFDVKTVENLIEAGNGLFAFGQYVNAIITLSEKMEVGTGYHEMFEGVFDVFLSKQEKKRIFAEFKNREGSFVDRETGVTTKYSKATDHQAKEQMAEEFRDKKLFNIDPPVTKTSFIRSLYNRLIDWINKFLKRDNIKSLQEVFARMDSAYYKSVPYKNTPTKIPQKRRQIGTLDTADTNTVVRNVVSRVFQTLFDEGKTAVINELDFTSFKADEVYNSIYRDLYNHFWGTKSHHLPQIALSQGMTEEQYETKYSPVWENINDNWDEIKRYSGEVLKTYKIVQELAIEDKESEESEYSSKNDDSYTVNDFDFDGKKNAPASIKLLIATIQESMFVISDKIKISALKEGQGERKITYKKDDSTGLQLMVDYAKTFNYLLEQLSSLNTLSEKENRIKELAAEHPNFARLYSRLKIGQERSFEDWMLAAKFYTTFAKQEPIPLIQYNNADGTSSTGAADIRNSVKILANDWLSNLKTTDFVSYKEDKFVLDASHLKNINTSTPKGRLEYLATLGIYFEDSQVANMSTEQINKIAKAVESIKYILKSGRVNATSIKTLKIEQPLNTIFEIQIKTNTEAPESTFVNISGKPVQRFTQTNAVSRINNDLNNSLTKIEATRKLPHLLGGYASDSLYINEVLYDEAGNKKAMMSLQYIQGTLDLKEDEAKPTDKLAAAEMLNQSINQNLQESYSVLLPADSKTEYMLKMRNLFTGVNEASLKQLYKYYQTEQALGGSKNRLFNFLEDGLSEKAFNEKVTEFITSEVEKQLDILQTYNVVEHNKRDTYTWHFLDKNFAKANKYNNKDLSLEQVKEILTLRTVNYLINNTEIHKIFFGDPAEYADPTKRYKSFLSGREQAIYDTPEYNAKLDEVFNTVAGVPLKQGDPGYQVYSDVMKTVTMEDVFSEVAGLEGYEQVNGTDAQGMAHLTSYKHMRLKNGPRWNYNDEKQYQYVMAMDRLLMEEDGLFNYEGRAALKTHDKKLVAKGDPKLSTFPPLKPIATGFTGSKPFLDKYSIFPLSYSATRGKNIASQYKRMLDNNISYTIVKTGRKVGADEADSFYTADGTPNTQPYNPKAIVEIPFKWFGIQVETLGEHDKTTTGTQLAKLSTVNLYSGGKPANFKGTYEEWFNLSEEEKQKNDIYNLVEKERRLKEEMIENGYITLLNKVGIKEDGTVDNYKLLKTIKDELTRRELNTNLREALRIDPNTDEFAIPIEALTNYEQIKNILFSYISKYVAKPKVNGGSKIMVSGSAFEVAGKRVVAKEVTDKKTGKKKNIFVSSGLKFYTKDAPYMEVLLPAWFGKKLRALGLDDQDPDVLSKISPEILTGVGFRIPTQELNSVEVFRVAGFLPEWMGDTVVVPEAITTKAGADFDVDKLNTYLKNVYINPKGELALVPYFDSVNKAKAFFISEFFEGIDKELVSIPNKIEEKGRLLKLVQDVVFGLASDKVKNKWSPIIRNMMGDNEDTVELEDSIMHHLEKMGARLETITNDTLLEAMANAHADKMYTQSLENEYLDTLTKLITHPDNFERLTTPNSSDELIKLRGVLQEINEEEFGDGNIKTSISPTYMNNLRVKFLLGKGGVGIAAIAQVHNAIVQKMLTFIDPQRILSLKDASEKKYIKDASVKLPHNTVSIKGKNFSTLSFAKDIAGRFISDKISQYINGFVDVAKDAFLVHIGVTKNNASTYLFLERLGVPTDVVVFFMNQPIIKEYTKLLESRGMSYPYIDDNIKDVKKMFPSKKVVNNFNTQDSKYLADDLVSNIQKYYGPNKEKFTDDENAMQQFILGEYLKYNVMASNLFRVVQGTNYDTANLISPYLAIRKNLKTQDAEENNIFSSAKNILDKSFLGKMRTTILESVDILSDTLFKLLNSDNRKYLEPVIEDLANRRGLSEADYMKAARKVEQSFISHLLQTQVGLNKDITELLINNKTAVARVVAKFRKRVSKLPQSRKTIIDSLRTENIEKESATKTLKMFSKASDTLSQDLYVSLMEELRDNPATMDLYKDIVSAALIQSGVSMSPISFADIIPIDDYKNILIEALGGLNNPEVMQAFLKTDSFYRNNWSDSTIVPFVEKKVDIFGDELNSFYSTAVLNIAKARGIEAFPMMKVSTMAKASTSPFITTKLAESFEEVDDLGQVVTVTLPSKTVLLKRLERTTGEPFVLNNKHLYFPVNAWGDRYKGQESYTSVRKSVYDNGTLKFDHELSNDEVLLAVLSEQEEAMQPEKVVPSQESTKMESIANIPQNKVSGVESFGSLVTANPSVIKVLGPNPHSIDMIEAGFRTRTTRSESEMAKYAIKVGDTIKHFGKSADGTTKEVFARVTAIHPKGSAGWKGTWAKEGWRTEDVNVIDRFKDGAAAIEFEVVKQPSSTTGKTTSSQEKIIELPKYIKEFKIGEQVQDFNFNVWEIISQEEFKKESGIGLVAGVKARFITNVNPNENRKQDYLNPDSTTYIKPNSVNILGENTKVQSVIKTTISSQEKLFDPILPKINIYAGTGENVELSNFAKRPFKLGDGIMYPTVEHAFQLEKLQYSNAYTDNQKEAIVKDMNNKSAAQVKAFGKTIKGLDVNRWNEDASTVMKDLLKTSFEQNPEALQKLLTTGNAELTHAQDKGKWGTEFPKLLMEVRQELKQTTKGVIITPEGLPSIIDSQKPCK